MNSKDTYCVPCAKNFACRKDYTDHRATMRALGGGKEIGHEIITKSIRGSQAGDKKNMAEVSGTNHSSNGKYLFHSLLSV